MTRALPLLVASEVDGIADGHDGEVPRGRRALHEGDDQHVVGVADGALRSLLFVVSVMRRLHTVPEDAGGLAPR